MMKKIEWKKMQFKSQKSKIATFVVAGVILLFVLIAALAGVLFPDTAFAQLVADTIGRFFDIVAFFRNNYVKVLESLTIIFFLWVISHVLRFLISTFTKVGKQSATIGIIVNSIIKYAAVIIGLFMILSAWGVQTATLLAGAGILGLAISFGAQSLIEDVISGLFIIFEKDFQVGDVVEIDGFRGTVKGIGIRTTKIEDLTGDVKIINNSDIRGAVNTSNNLHPAICDLSLSYSTDIQKFELLLREELPKIKEAIPDIMEGPFYKGVQNLGESGVVVRIIARTEEMKKYQVLRDLNREMKLFCDRHGFEIPFNQVVVHLQNKEPQKPE